MNPNIDNQNLISKSEYFTIQQFLNSHVHSQQNNNNIIPISPENFSILHLNVRSLNKNFENLELLLSALHNFPFSVLGISETWLNPCSPPLYNLENYKMIRTDRNDGRGGGGVAFYIHSDLNFKVRHDLSIESAESLFIEITNLKGKNRVIGVIYRPPDKSVDEFLHSLDECLGPLNNENKDLFLMGDFNIDLSIPHTLSNRLLNTVTSNGLYPYIDKPTRITATTQTIIDNIFSNVFDTVSNGIIYYDLSDHLPIFLLCNNNYNKKIDNNTTHMRRNVTTRNIESLKFDLGREEWQDVYAESDCNIAYENFKNKLSRYYNKNIPLIRNKNHKNKINNPWITRGIFCSIHTRNNLYKLSLREPSNININKYKQYRNKLTTIIRLSRKLYYSHKLENSKNNTNSLWKIINDLIGNKKTAPSTNTLMSEGKEITAPNLIADEFNNYFTNIGPKLANNINSNIGHFSDYLSEPFNKSLFFTPTNPNEILNIVRSLKSSKSCGYDELNVFTLKQIIHYLASPLAHIFNLSLSSGIFPSAFKIAKVIPVFKKDDPTHLNNYRPISILSSLSKILEKIVHKRLYSFLNDNNLLIPNQFGFRNQHSTDHAIIQLCDKIITAISNKEHAVGIFMDLSKAFDTINHNILIYKLRSYGIRGKVLNWFEDYLRNRQQFVAFKGHNSNITNISCGVPQGSILGPLLFLIYVNDIVKSSTIASFFLFADDTTVFHSHKNIATLTEILNTELSKISRWFKCNKLSLNVDKTNFIIFQSSHLQNVHNINLHIDRLPLVQKESFKFLGVYIDSHLSWNDHTHNISILIARGIGILHKLKHLLTSKTLYMLYNSLILPYITYCNTVWGNCCKTKINAIFLLQKKALRICTHSDYLASTDPIFCRLKTLKITDIYNLQTAIFMYKFSNNLLPLSFRSFFEYNKNIHTYPTRHSSDFHLVNPKTLLAHKSIRHVGPDIWNSLPLTIKSSTRLFTFKALTKRMYLSQYKTEIS